MSFEAQKRLLLDAQKYDIPCKVLGARLASRDLSAFEELIKAANAALEKAGKDRNHNGLLQMIKTEKKRRKAAK